MYARTLVVEPWSLSTPAYARVLVLRVARIVDPHLELSKSDT